MSETVERLRAALEDRYEIERPLGEGGMAHVYLAADVKHGRKVAIKVLKPELAAVIGGERFVAEIRTTAQLQHPHILPLFDSGESELEGGPTLEFGPPKDRGWPSYPGRLHLWRPQPDHASTPSIP